MTEIKPIIGISMGDPSGIGPEIAVKTLARKEIYEICKPLIVGDANAIKDALRMTALDLKINPISEVRQALFQFGTLDVYDLKNVDMAKLQYGKVSAMSGHAAFEAITKVIELAQKKEIDATVTGPINKESINLAGHHYSGHTEIYAHYTHTEDYTMMLAHENLRVVHVSTHVSLKEACARVRKDRVLKVIKLAWEACRKIGIADPRIGVAGLNPHAGERGNRRDHPCDRGGKGAEDQRRRAHPAGQPVLESEGRSVRHRRCHVSRPGSHPPQGCRFQLEREEAEMGFHQRGEHHPRLADHPELGGPRHGIRQGGQGHGV
jgi:hypothetical protein